MMTRRLAFFILLLFVNCFQLHSAAIFVSPAGNDGNSGTMQSPYYTISKAAAAAQPGDTIYVRGGNYTYNYTIKLDKSGTAGSRYFIFAYADEKPFLDFSAMADADANRGFLITGSYWHIKGLEIYKAGDNGMKIEGNYNIIEFCILHHNRDSGIQIGLSKDEPHNAGDLAAFNLILNCDSYLNYDPRKAGANADGFACKLSPGPGNVFKGCRSWENSDDGWDLYQNEYRVVLEDCWTWHNGDPAVVGNPSDWGGNGNGFKLGGNSSYGAPNIAIRCVVFDHNYGNSNCKGFDQNDNNEGITLHNCTSWLNRYNYALNNDLSNPQFHEVKNCVGFLPRLKNFSFCTNTNQANNSWQATGVTADTNDFRSISAALAKAPRKPDGSLPDNGFAKLVQGSDLIDKGISIGYPFFGTAPDLGAFEYYPMSDARDSEYSVSDYSMEQNYPNPFNPATVIEYNVSKPGFITMRLFNLLGKEIGVLTSGFRESGNYRINYNASGMAAGAYYYVLEAGKTNIARKMILVK